MQLQVQEDRYTSLIEQALRSDRYIGLVQTRDTSASAGATCPALFRVGSLGEITGHERTKDGFYTITIKGVKRYRILEEEAQTQTPWRQARVCYDIDDKAQGSGELGPEKRRILIEALHAYLEVNDLETDWKIVMSADDEGLVSGLAMICPFDPVEKQALIECGTIGEQANTLIALMQFSEKACRHHGISNSNLWH